MYVIILFCGQSDVNITFTCINTSFSIITKILGEIVDRNFVY